MKKLLLALLIAGAGEASALSLRLGEAELFLGDVNPGGVAHGRLELANTGRDPADLRRRMELPRDADLLDGYEPLPDLAWARWETDADALPPDGRADSRVTVKLPRDERLRHGQYQFDCLMSGRDPKGRVLELRSKVLVAVGEPDPKDAPDAADDSPFQLGARSARLPKGAKSYRLKLVNAGSEDLTVRLSTLRLKDKDARLEEGFRLSPNPRFLRTGAPVAVKAGRIAETELTLQVPEQARYRGRRWAFVVAADAEGRGGKVERRRFTLYVNTE